MAFNNYPYTDAHELNLDWILKHVKDLISALAEANENIDKNADKIEALEKELHDFINNIDDDYIRSVVDDYLQYGVFFGLSDEGYYIVYIPSGWDDITFRTTGLDTTISGYDFGHLCLYY